MRLGGCDVLVDVFAGMFAGVFAGVFVGVFAGVFVGGLIEDIGQRSVLLGWRAALTAREGVSRVKMLTSKSTHTPTLQLGSLNWFCKQLCSAIDNPLSRRGLP